MRTQRMSYLTKLTFETTPFTPGSVLDYQPGAKKVSIYPALESGFPDVVGVDIPLRSKAPANLFSNGWAAWLEVEGKRRVFYCIAANGDFIECNSEAVPTGGQWFVIMSDPAGKIEGVRCLPADLSDPAEVMRTAAIMHEFEANSKPIAKGETKILPIDRDLLVHRFTAEISAPGATFVHTGNVSDIRAKKYDPDGFKYFKKAHVWNYGSSKAIIAESTLNGFHVATFDSNGKQVYTERANTFNGALNSAHKLFNQ
jgi:hypothetical protein